MACEWGIHPRKEFFMFVVSRVKDSNFAGAWYELAKDRHGNVKGFWLRKNAQAYADTLNGEPK